jgi:hypothetical protein
MAVIPVDQSYIKCTLFFESLDAIRAVGWTETHWLIPPFINLKTALSGPADSLAKKRAACLGAGYRISYIRVSKEGVFRDSQVSNPNYSSQAANKIQPPGEGDFAQSVLYVRMEGNVFTRKTLFFSGVDDSLQVINSDITDPVFKRSFNAWVAECKLNWGFLGLLRGPNGRPVAPKIKTFYAYDNIFIRGHTSRRRGRPFGLYRGRRYVPPKVP